MHPNSGGVVQTGKMPTLIALDASAESVMERMLTPRVDFYDGASLWALFCKKSDDKSTSHIDVVGENLFVSATAVRPNVIRHTDEHNSLILITHPPDLLSTIQPTISWSGESGPNICLLLSVRSIDRPKSA